MARIVHFKLIRLGGILIRILGKDELDLGDDFGSGQLAPLLQLAGGTELAAHRAAGHGADADHPSFITGADLVILQFIGLFIDAILGVGGEERISDFDRSAISQLEGIDDAVGEATVANLLHGWFLDAPQCSDFLRKSNLYFTLDILPATQVPVILTLPSPIINISNNH